MSERDNKQAPRWFLLNRAWILGGLLGVVCGACDAMTWSDWWRTADQRARELMDQGQFQSAYETFKRPDWKAAAAYRAGQYQQAVSLYEGLQDPQSLYNQANALAHLGQYARALEALNAVLKQDPTQADALHNREVIQALLKQQQEQKKKDASQDQDKKENPSSPQKKSQKKESGQDTPEQEKAKPDQTQEKTGQDQSTPDQAKNQAQEKQAQASPKTKKQEEASKPSDPDEKKSEEGSGKQAKASVPPTLSEEEKEHWLAFIPDDPGAFLKEKFLRDYLRLDREPQS